MMMENEEEKAMAYVWADNIISPLGATSEENYLSVKAGKSGLRAYPAGSRGIPEGFTASLLPSIISLEELAYRSAYQALKSFPVKINTQRVAFILSSTKGPIERLGKEDDEAADMAAAAQRIAHRLGIPSKPFVVCNACVSGLSALILATRLLSQNHYDYAVVCGVDTPSRFIISGFQSLKALSPVPCRPFDMERFGLNLGEAAATMVLGRQAPAGATEAWRLEKGYIRNDAYHISAPSKTSEGLYKALMETMKGVEKEDLAFINAHGTATLFNDQMESVAIQRAGLTDVPVNALKGYVGHTLGAAGILETVLSMKAAADHTVIGTKGYQELGVSGQLDLSAEHRSTDKHAFIKMLSGFGGCNATLLAQPIKSVSWEKADYTGSPSRRFALTVKHRVRILPSGVWVDGSPFSVANEKASMSLLTALYKQKIGDYPKYYKMDALCRLGFVASELLLQAEQKQRTAHETAPYPADDSRAIVLFNHSSSIYSDKKYLETIRDQDNYYPSPSVFVYTLPNIVTGEVAIRNGYHGETSFYILPDKDERQMQEVLATTCLDPKTKSVLAGWIDYQDADHFDADLYIAEKTAS